MMKDEVLTVKDAVHKLQLSLLEGIKHENQLSAAGSLISQSDYEDVVTERKIANTCGYPLCSSSLPSERPRKGHYHVSLKEHKVYDLQETYMYCSSSCLINSRAFAGSLLEERSSTLNHEKFNEILKLFEGLSLDSLVNMGKNGDLGLSELKILEKRDAKSGDVSLEEWIGPSNAIEGYVPQRDWNSKPQQPNNLIERVKQEQLDIMSNYMNFTSTIITQDEYSISKTVPPVKAEEAKGKVSGEEVNDWGNPMPKPAAPSGSFGEARFKKINKDKNDTTENKLTVSDEPPGPSQYNQNRNTTKTGNKLCFGKESAACVAVLKSSFKTSDSKKSTRSVAWVDEKTDGDGQNLRECIELEDNNGAVVTSYSLDKEVGEDSYRFALAEACVRALSQTAEAVASGKSDASDAVSEADIIILPPPHGMNEAKSQESGDVIDSNPVLLEWPKKPGFSNDDLFDSEDSWYDSPPVGFNLTLSPFSTMFMALFAWISSSSLAYIYGRDESFYEDYLCVNGKEYPLKIVMSDGRSSEIKQTLAGCLARALPGLVAELRLPTPISTLEQGMGRFLDTMSFLDPLPPFRMKQWQVIVLLFLDAFSVSRIPGLAPYMMDRRVLLSKVLEGARISAGEYEIMKEQIIPLGRVPQLSTQSGGG